ncbi:hypothetical protein GCM10025331_81420 [Actinoplanes utahensis]|nr:hypothetical protein Aut01nite_51960 [Actinoplanes utahensis]
MASSLDGCHTESAGGLTIEGPTTLAHSALRLGLVDVVELLLCPTVVGGRTRVLPDGLRLALTLTRERRFANGMVQLTYDVHDRAGLTDRA